MKWQRRLTGRSNMARTGVGNAMSLLDRVAIVTGGGSGIGEALSQELARRGASVIVADINSADASRVAAQIGRTGGRAEARQVDVSSEDAVRRVVE